MKYRYFLMYFFQASVLYLSFTFSNVFLLSFFVQHTKMCTNRWTFYPLHLKTCSLLLCLTVFQICKFYLRLLYYFKWSYLNSAVVYLIIKLGYILDYFIKYFSVIQVHSL